MWGAPVYVLDPRLQDGHKIPKFEPRSRRGLNLGWSPKHASTVPLVLNLPTGKVSPQFHVVFDDWFSTVSSEPDGKEEAIDSDEWNSLLVNGKFQVHFDDEDSAELDEEWLNELERIERHQQAAARVQKRMPMPTPTVAEPVTPPAGTQVAPSVDQVPLQPQIPVSQGLTPSVPPAVPPARESRPERELKPAVPKRQEQPTVPPMRLRPHPKKQQEPGYWKKWMNKLAMLMAMSNGPILAMAKDAVGSPAAHVAMSGFDAVTETFDCVDYISYKAVTASPKLPR